MKILTAITILAFAISPVFGQDKQIQKKPKMGAVKLTSLEVELQTGPDKVAWGKAWKDSAPVNLSFRWSTGYPNVGSAIWQVSTDPQAKNVIARGDAGKPQTGGSAASFIVDFRPIVGSSTHRPQNYYVRVLTFKSQTKIASKKVQPLRKTRETRQRTTKTRETRQRKTKTKTKTRETRQSPPVRVKSATPSATVAAQAGPPSRPVHVAIIQPGANTQFSEIGMHPEFANEMPIVIDLQTFKLRGTGGDEDPYLFVVAVFADGTTIFPELSAGRLIFPNSRAGLAHSTGNTHENLGVEDIDPGADINIPNHVGRFERKIKPIGMDLLKQLANSTGQSFTPAHQKSLRDITYVGVLVIGMEEDAIPSTEVVNAARDQLVTEMDKAFKKVLRDVEVPITGQPKMPDVVGKVIAMTNDIRERLIDSTTARTVDELKDYLWIPGFPTLILVPGIANQDDYIGFGAAMFTYEEILNAGTGGLPIRLKLDQSSEPIYYRIEGRIRRK